MTAAPALPELPAYGELHPIDTPTAAMQLGQTCAAYPVPTLFELHRVVDVTQVSGTGRIAVGVVWPYAGGALMRWSTPRPPAGYPMRVRQIEIVDSIAEIMGVHGHAGATRLRLLDATDADGRQLAAPLDHDAPEVFAVVEPGGDVEAWGVWWGRDERAVVYWPEVTALGGRRQVSRVTQYRTLSSLINDLPAPAHDGQHRLVYLNMGNGRRLVRRVRTAHVERLERAGAAMALAEATAVLDPSAVRAQFGAPRRP